MLLCAVLRIALSTYLSGVLQILILLQNSGISGVQASLPPGAEDEIILIEHLPGRRVHLQDFFWTGPEDAPPWVDPDQGLTFYETRTVHHTVTVYSTSEEKDTPIFPRPGTYDPECTSCIEPTPRLDDDEDQSIGVLIGEDPGPRYWLLTVLRAGEDVPPKIELKLARLYRAAFSRQQHRHLGLLTTDPRPRRAAQEQNSTEDKTINRSSENNTRISVSKITSSQSELKSPIIGKAVRMIEVPSTKFTKKFLPSSDVDDSDESNGKDYNFHPRNVKPSNSSIKNTNPSSDFDDSSNTTGKLTTLEEDEVESASAGGVRLKLRSLSRPVNEVVQVRMQNTSVMEGGATRLIYSVHLGGKPVPAETAARDMALLSPQEVALELGTPVLIQSEPFLKESRPLALSRKRDAWLLIGAAGAGVILLAIVLIGLIVAAKRKRAHSAVVGPPNRSILKKERENVSTTTAGLDNAAFSVSETEVKTDGTSQRQTPCSLSRTSVTPETPESLEPGIHEVSSEGEEEAREEKLGSKARRSNPWDLEERSQRNNRQAYGRISRTNAIDPPRTPDSVDSIDQMETLDSLENEFVKPEEATASPHSYLSMPSCKQFPSMRSVEPLSKVLEPVMVRHLDIESPEVARRDNGHAGGNGRGRKFLVRTPSAIEDPGVVGPIVWSLRKHGLSLEAEHHWIKRPVVQSIDRFSSTGYGTSETDLEPGYMGSSGPVGRARRRLHELLEDSFSLFGSRDSKTKEPPQVSVSRPTSAPRIPDTVGVHSERRLGATHVSPLGTPTTEMKSRPHTSRPHGFAEDIAETGTAQPRGAWGTRPLSAGPFHRPNLPEVDTRRILTDCRLPPEDPAVPLIASIKKELEKFHPQ